MCLFRSRLGTQRCQRQFTRANYPRVQQQSALHQQHYIYQPREAVVRQHYQSQGMK